MELPATYSLRHFFDHGPHIISRLHIICTKMSGLDGIMALLFSLHFKVQRGWCLKTTFLKDISPYCSAYVRQHTRYNRSRERKILLAWARICLSYLNRLTLATDNEVVNTPKSHLRHSMSSHSTVLLLVYDNSSRMKKVYVWGLRTTETLLLSQTKSNDLRES